MRNSLMVLIAQSKKLGCMCVWYDGQRYPIPIDIPKLYSYIVHTESTIILKKNIILGILPIEGRDVYMYILDTYKTSRIIVSYYVQIQVDGMLVCPTENIVLYNSTHIQLNDKVFEFPHGELIKTYCGNYLVTQDRVYRVDKNELVEIYEFRSPVCYTSFASYPHYLIISTVDKFDHILTIGTDQIYRINTYRTTSKQILHCSRNIYSMILYKKGSISFPKEVYANPNNYLVFENFVLLKVEDKLYYKSDCTFDHVVPEDVILPRLGMTTKSARSICSIKNY